MKLSVRVEIEVPARPGETTDQAAERLARIAAEALMDQGATVLHAASVQRRR